MSSTSTCYMLFRVTDGSNPFEYLNEDISEILNGEVYDNEQAAATALASGRMQSPILVQLDVSAREAQLWKESGSAKELVSHVKDVNRKAAEFDGEKIKLARR